MVSFFYFGSKNGKKMESDMALATLSNTLLHVHNIVVGTIFPPKC